MPDKRLLEEFPLYRKLEGYLGYSLNQIPKPGIVMHCDVCDSPQTFNMINEYFDRPEGGDDQARGRVSRPIYMCRGCHRFKYFFLVLFHADENAVTKIGQYPPWSIDIPRGIAKSLGDHAADYRKGLICESQGYGIGAFAYYRRIVELTIDELLDEIASIVPPDEQAKYSEALARTKQAKVAQEKIEIAKDVLPSSLRPDGLNPLSVLHDVLSEGLHVESDERCMALAGSVREVLAYLISQVLSAKASQKSFTTSIRKLLDRKTPDQNPGASA